jgi:hypothetical protein
MGQGWTAAGHAVPFDPWTLAGRIGAAVFLLLLAWIVIRALAQHRRYRAVGVLGETDIEAVREAVARAEKRTVGEILRTRRPSGSPRSRSCSPARPCSWPGSRGDTRRGCS